MSFTLFPGTRHALANDCLAGLSVGDALGAQFFVPGNKPSDLLDARVPAAIAGGVVAAHTGLTGIPPAWLAAREPLPPWLPTSV